MSRIEPGWGMTDAHLSERVDFAPTGHRFEIALGSRLRKRWGEVKARSFESKGSIRVSDDRVTIQTFVSRLLGAVVESTLELRRADIYNVRVVGKIVLFDLVNGPGELEPVILRAHNKRQAAAIAAVMPDQMTPRYATENHQRLRFFEQITKRTPHLWSTWTILAVTSLVFVAMASNGAGLLIAKSSYAIAHGSNYGPYTLSGQWWRLLTAVFIHFGLFHFVVNMIVLVQTGRIAERLFGNARFMTIYLFAGLTGSLMSLLWRPGINSAGASGAIFGVLGALLAYVIRYSESIPRAVFLKHFRLTAVFILYNLYSGFTHRGIDNGAHVGGLIGGFMLACVLAPPLDTSGSHPKQRVFVFGSSIAVSCAVLGGLMWALLTLSTRTDRQEDIHFSEVLHQLGPTAERAAADMKTLGREPATPEARAEYAHRIRTTILPEWNQLYKAVDDVQLPAGSVDAARKDGLLRYYADMSRALEMMANMADNDRFHDPRATAQTKAMLDDAKRQLALLKK